MFLLVQYSGVSSSYLDRTGTVSSNKSEGDSCICNQCVEVRAEGALHCNAMVLVTLCARLSAACRQQGAECFLGETMVQLWRGWER